MQQRECRIAGLDNWGFCCWQEVRKGKYDKVDYEQRTKSSQFCYPAIRMVTADVEVR